MNERTEILIGNEGIKRLASKNVAIFGIGGVGGYVAEMLARAGICNLTIVDFDKIDATNINRQIIALSSTVGKNKVDVMKKRLLDINPNINLNVVCDRYTMENSDILLSPNYDFVVDAIDDVKNKTSLIVECHKKNINIVSAMGAGNRIDVPTFEVADIYETFNDGLAKILRKNLKQAGIDKHTVVYTKSLAKKSKTVGSISYYPAMCGCTISAYVITQLLKK